MQLTSTTHRLRLAHPWRIARTSKIEDPQVVTLELTLEDGIVGRGEAPPIGRYQETTETVAAFLAKVDPIQLSINDLKSFPEYLNHISADDWSAKCAIEMALVDAAAKNAGKSVSDFMGLEFSEGKHITSFTVGIDTPETIRKKTEAAERFPILKMKMGGPTDRENLRALRDVSPSKKLRIDANEGWSTREQALEMIEWLAADGNVELVEQPLRAAASIEDWSWLKTRSPLPIIADESYRRANDTNIAAECFHGVNVKLSKTGGILGAIEALSTARKAGLKTMLGCMIETSISISAAAHLAGLCDFLDLDGNLLITNDPFIGVTAENGVLSFATCSERNGLRVQPRARPI